jgi:hypothetical protein
LQYTPPISIPTFLYHLPITHMAGTKMYKITPSYQRVVWKPRQTSRGIKLKQVGVVGTAVHSTPSTPSRHATSPYIPDMQYDHIPLAVPLSSKVSRLNWFWWKITYAWKKTQNDYLRQFKNKRMVYLGRILSNEAPPPGHQCQSCNMREIGWRCLDCIG